MSELKKEPKLWNFRNIYNKLYSLEWSEFYNLTDVEQAAEFYQNSSDKMISAEVPIVTAKKSFRYPLWFFKYLVRNLRMEENARKKWKKRKADRDFARYKELRKFFKRQIRIKEKLCQTTLENEFYENPKTFCRYVWGKRDRLGAHGEIKIDKGVTCTESENIAEAFAEHFSSVFNPVTTNVTLSSNPSQF